MVERRVTGIAGDVGTRRPRPRRRRPGRARRLRHRHPLGRHGRLRLAARQRGRGQPAGPEPHRRHASTTSASRPTWSRCRPATWPATGGARPPRSRSTTAPSSSTSTGGARWPAPAGPAPTPTPRAARPRRLARFRKEARGRAGRRRHPRCWPPRPSSAARRGSRTAWSRPAGPGPPRWAGPTPTPTPRPWASGRCSPSGATCRSRSCARRSSSRRWPSPARAGSGASAWPSRSSSPTPGACSRSSPACPRASSTSSPSTWWWRPSSTPPPAARPRASPTSSRWPRARPTRCATATWSTWCRAGSSSTRSTTARASRSWCPTGRSPAGAGCSASSSGRKHDRPGREDARSRCRCGASRPSGRPASRTQARGGRAGAGLRRAVRRLRRVRGDLRRRPPAGPLGRARRRRPAGGSASTPGSSTGPTYVRDDPPALGGAARPGAHHARRPHGRGPDDAPAPPGARPRPPPRRLRPGEHAHRLERGGVVLVAGHPAPAPRGPAALRAQDAGRGALAAGARPRATAATSCATSTAATTGPRSTSSSEDANEMFSELLLAKSFPAAIRRVREHRAPGTARC